MQQRADWGVAIETVAQRCGLGFMPLQAEEYGSSATPARRFDRPAVRPFVTPLQDGAMRAELTRMGFAGVSSPRTLTFVKSGCPAGRAPARHPQHHRGLGYAGALSRVVAGEF